MHSLPARVSVRECADTTIVNSGRCVLALHAWRTISSADAVADVGGVRGIDHAQDLEFDFGGEHVEQSVSASCGLRDRPADPVKHLAPARRGAGCGCSLEERPARRKGSCRLPAGGAIGARRTR